MIINYNFDFFYFAFVALLFGLCFGSFLNVCIFRIQAEISLWKPPSSCPACKNLIKWHDNIPVLSWFFLGGKCRFCKGKISIQYPMIELTTGLFFMVIYMIYGLSWVTPIYCLAVFGLLLATFIDLQDMWIPDRVSIGGMVAFPVFSALVPELHGQTEWIVGFIDALIGLAVGFGLFWGIGKAGTALFKKEAMGFGDVKLMGALGALLGWQAVLYILFFSALAGSVIGFALIGMNKKELSSRIPYGPYLALAAFSWILGGFRLWEAYKDLFLTT